MRDYIARNASKCILLSATPYNKAYLDLANQLRLFLEPEDVVGIRPEEYLRRDCDGRPDEFTRRHQCPLNCLAAFEKSAHPDDWREMMRLFMVRRTRSFVERNYAFTECPACQTIVTATQEACPNVAAPRTKSDRRFLVLEGGSRFHFPKRQPKDASLPHPRQAPRRPIRQALLRHCGGHRSPAAPAALRPGQLPQAARSTCRRPPTKPRS